MIKFSQFRKRYLDGRMAGDDADVRNAATMAHAYFLLSDDRAERCAAREFGVEADARIHELIARPVVRS